MKYLLACLLVVSCGANAEAPYQGFCDDFANFVQSSMSARQMNVPLSDTLKVAETYDNKMFIDATRVVYSSPVFTEMEDIQYVVDQAATDAFEACNSSSLGDNSP